MELPPNDLNNNPHLRGEVGTPTLHPLLRGPQKDISNPRLTDVHRIGGAGMTAQMHDGDREDIDSPHIRISLNEVVRRDWKRVLHNRRKVVLAECGVCARKSNYRSHVTYRQCNASILCPDCENLDHGCRRLQKARASAPRTALTCVMPDTPPPTQPLFHKPLSHVHSRAETNMHLLHSHPSRALRPLVGIFTTPWHSSGRASHLQAHHRAEG